MSCSQGMTGKGWTWIGTDGATTSIFTESPNLRRAMQGMVGTRPKHGEGVLYQRLLKIWKEKDAASFPGLIHLPRILQVRPQPIFCGPLSCSIRLLINLPVWNLGFFLCFAGFALCCTSLWRSSHLCACSDNTSWSWNDKRGENILNSTLAVRIQEALKNEIYLCY